MKKFIHEITKVAKEVADCLLVCHCHDVISSSSTQTDTWHRDAALVAMHVHAKTSSSLLLQTKSKKPRTPVLLLSSILSLHIYC